MRTMLRTTLTILMLAVAVVDAAAQEATASRTARDSHATVQFSDRSGTIEGRLVALTPDSVALLVKGKRVDIPLGRVSVVAVGGDPVGDGAVRGAIIVGIWCALVCGQGMGNGSEYALGVLSSVGYGALIGAGIDALNTKQTTVFRRPATAAQAPRPTVVFKWTF